MRLWSFILLWKEEAEKSSGIKNCQQQFSALSILLILFFFQFTRKNFNTLSNESCAAFILFPSFIRVEI
jgi:hypothetical protein